VNEELALKLAPHNKGQCRICKRVGPLNGALVTWWAGVPVSVVCPECFALGRRVVLKRREEGVEVMVLEHDTATIQLVSSTADISQAAAQRAPSKGW
jgi:hypothetical protein